MAATIFFLIYYLSIIISILSSAKKSRFIFGTHYSGFGTGTGTVKTREISGLGTRDRDSRAALTDADCRLQTHTVLYDTTSCTFVICTFK